MSNQQGRTWQEYQNGTASRIVLPCPHCDHWVRLEREQLTGWQEAGAQLQAREQSLFHYPDCGGQWAEAQRVEGNRNAKLVHKGQELTDQGELTGEPQRSETLGFRWSAVNNLFLTAGDIFRWPSI